jgi:hypothetical protein
MRDSSARLEIGMPGVAHRLGQYGKVTLAAVIAATLIGAFASVASAAPVAAHATTHATSHSLVGKWSISGGVFKFVKTGSNTYKDKVIKKRAGVFCPKVNDKSGQIVMHKKSKDLYKGTWKWFYTSCTFAGYGATTIKIAKSGKTAVMVSEAPKGTGGGSETFTLKRLK